MRDPHELHIWHYMCFTWKLVSNIDFEVWNLDHTLTLSLENVDQKNINFVVWDKNQIINMITCIGDRGLNWFGGLTLSNCKTKLLIVVHEHVLAIETTLLHSCDVLL